MVDYTLVTTDGTIVDDNLSHIPDDHSGIVVVRRPAHLGSISESYTIDLLAQLKSVVSDWQALNYRRAIVTMLGSDVSVAVKSGMTVAELWRQNLTHPEFSSGFAQALDQARLH